MFRGRRAKERINDNNVQHFGMRQNVVGEIAGKQRAMHRKRRSSRLAQIHRKIQRVGSYLLNLWKNESELPVIMCAKNNIRACD